MIRKLLLLCAVPLAAVAQNADAAATDDGSRLFFTSENRLTGTNQSFRSKIFSWDAAHGVQLVYDPPAENVCGRFPSVAPVRPLQCVSIAGDGSLVAFHTLTFDDPPRSTGMLLHTDTGEVEIAGRFAVISRNGRFLYNGDTVTDRTTGASRLVPPSIFVGDDGSVLYQDGINLHRLEANGDDHFIAIPALRFGSIDSIDTNGTMVGIFSVPFVPVPFVVNLVDTRTGVEVNLARGSSTGSPFLSPDATRVVFSAPVSPDTSTRQLLTCRTVGAECQPLTAAPRNASPVALSRDATIVYAVTFENRIFRIDTRSNRADEAFAFPWFYPLVEAPALRGSLLRFYAVNAGGHITANGRDVPILSSPGGLPVVQIPWELPDTWVKFTMYGGASPFETFTRTYPVADYAPRGFEPGSPGLNEGQSAYRQDWSAGTVASPAVPGEIVHIYAVGLGPTECPIETGKPAPVDRLCRALQTPEWKWIIAPNVTVPAEVQFAGFAPGMIGMYQIDVRVPPYNGYEYITLSGIANVRIRPAP